MCTSFCVCEKSGHFVTGRLRQLLYDEVEQQTADAMTERMSLSCVFNELTPPSRITKALEKTHSTIGN